MLSTSFSYSLGDHFKIPILFNSGFLSGETYLLYYRFLDSRSQEHFGFIFVYDT